VTKLTSSWAVKLSTLLRFVLVICYKAQYEILMYRSSQWRTLHLSTSAA